MCKFSFQKIVGILKQTIAFTLTCIMIMTLCACGSEDGTDVASSSHTTTAQNHDLSSDDSGYHSSDCSEDDVNNSSTLLLGTESVKADFLEDSVSSEDSSSAASSSSKASNNKTANNSKIELCVGCKVNPINYKNKEYFCDDCMAERKCKYCKVGYANPINPICDDCYAKQQEQKIKEDPSYIVCKLCKKYIKYYFIDKVTGYCRNCYDYCRLCGKDAGKTFGSCYGYDYYCKEHHKYMKSTDPCVDCYARIPKNKYKDRRCPDCQSKKDSGLVYCPYRTHYVESLYKTTVYCYDCNVEMMNSNRFDEEEEPDTFCDMCGREIGTEPGMCEPYDTGVYDWRYHETIWVCKWYD